MQPIPAIPTRYAGVNFRSRLEARRAAMFDLLGWRWEYEPLDLNGYIPDFVLMFAHPMTVEIKPAMTVAECLPALDRMVHAGAKNCAVLGATIMHEVPGFAYPNNHDPAFGLIEDNGMSGLSHAPCQIQPCGSHWTLTTSTGWWGCNTSGGEGCHYRWCDSSSRQPGRRGEMPPEVTAFWREAGNLSQWRAVTPR
jgi:hypothetical protein